MGKNDIKPTDTRKASKAARHRKAETEKVEERLKREANDDRMDGVEDDDEDSEGRVLEDSADDDGEGERLGGGKARRWRLKGDDLTG